MASHGVGHVAEAARLRAVAVDRQRLAGQRLLHEARDHHAVAAGLARADGVEQAKDRHRQPMLVVIRQRQELIHHLGGGIGPAIARGRAQHDVVVLAEGHALALAVDLRGRGDQHLGPVAQRSLEHRLRAHDVGLDGMHRAAG